MQYIIEIMDEKSAEYAMIPILGSPAIVFIVDSFADEAERVCVFCKDDDICAKLWKELGVSHNLCFIDNEQYDALKSQGVETYIPDGLLPAFKRNAPIDYRSASSRAMATKALSREINDRLLDNGVYFVDPDNAYIGPLVQIGEGTVIYPGNIIEGATIIGRDCELGLGNRIISSNIGNSCVIQYTVITDSILADGIKIGPFCHIRPGSRIEAGVKIGDFVEIKNSFIGEGTKVPHLSYVGDSDVGERVNFGCGCVTVNYDGHTKSRTKIGDDVFIGCNVNMIAPISLGNGAYIAAGSTIDKDVNVGLAIARARQVNKESWIPTYKRK